MKKRELTKRDPTPGAPEIVSPGIELIPGRSYALTFFNGETVLAEFTGESMQHLLSERKGEAALQFSEWVKADAVSCSFILYQQPGGGVVRRISGGRESRVALGHTHAPQLRGLRLSHG